MKSAPLRLIAAMLLFGSFSAAFALPVRDYLTEEEIDAIQRNQEIDPRVKLYLKAASLRLTSAEARLAGQETEPGDPMEYFTPEGMLDAYYHILNSVMLNLEDAVEKFPPDRGGIRKALKHLQSVIKKDLPKLENLKRMAAAKEETELVRLILRAIDISTVALEGAEEALEGRFSEY